MFSPGERCQYKKNQLGEVICQLRFPEILTINANAPSVFQEFIRAEYPRYDKKIEMSAPKITNTPSGLQIERQPNINNYQFVSSDGFYRVNLTSKFISLSCAQYTNWEAFAKHLDAPLAAFIKIYKPECFERIGLRYINFISRRSLALESVPYSELLQPPFLGVLSCQLPEAAVTQSCIDAEFAINRRCRVRIHAGLGTVKNNTGADSEVKFILDQDLFTPENTPIRRSADALESLHSHAYPIFRNSITDLLHNAMDP